MKLRKIIGQLFIIGFKGTSLFDNKVLYEDIGSGNLGGVILFNKHLALHQKKNNIESTDQLVQLSTDIQDVAETPLFISIDQEGGKVSRLLSQYGFPDFPSAQEMGADTSYALTREQALVTANLLHMLGVNLNFAPVADLYINSDNPIIGKLGRSFSADAQEVSNHCRIWLVEQIKKKVLGCLKHFPGHGSSSHDSHHDIVDITGTWRKEELAPYNQLITDGTANVVMLGHLFHRLYDPNYPASLSPLMINNLLRKELGFRGLIVTDDMQMKGVTQLYGFFDSLTGAINAGADMVIIGNNLKYDPLIFRKAVDHIIKSVTVGEISEQRIYEAYNRIQQTKELIK